jgi:hypothetical protein
MSEINWFEEMMSKQAAQEEIEEKVKKGEMTEEEALEINLKATLKSFGNLLDMFEAYPETERGKEIMGFDKSKLPEMRMKLAAQLKKVDGLGARLLKRKAKH